MTAKKPRKAKAEVAEEAVVHEDKTEAEVVVEQVTLEDFVAKHKVRSGLVVSFKYEALKARDGLEPRTEAEWQNAFTTQENKHY
jgi:hypothetical protein